MKQDKQTKFHFKPWKTASALLANEPRDNYVFLLKQSINIDKHLNFRDTCSVDSNMDPTWAVKNYG